VDRRPSCRERQPSDSIRRLRGRAVRRTPAHRLGHSPECSIPSPSLRPALEGPRQTVRLDAATLAFAVGQNMPAGASCCRGSRSPANDRATTRAVRRPAKRARPEVTRLAWEPRSLLHAAGARRAPDPEHQREIQFVIADRGRGSASARFDRCARRGIAVKRVRDGAGLAGGRIEKSSRLRLDLKTAAKDLRVRGC